MFEEARLVRALFYGHRLALDCGLALLYSESAEANDLNPLSDAFRSVFVVMPYAQDNDSFRVG